MKNKTVKTNKALLTVLIILIFCGGIFMVNAFSNGKISKMNVAGEEKYLVHKETIDKLEYWQNTEATYIFREGQLVGVENPNLNKALKKYTDLKERAFYAANYYIDLNEYDYSDEKIYPGGCHEFTWSIVSEGIETDYKVIVDIFEDGNINEIVFPLGTSKPITPKTDNSSNRISKEEAVNIYEKQVKKCVTEEIKKIKISNCNLGYNKDFVLVWKIIGDYSIEYESEEYNFYSEVHINALTGEIEYSQIG